MRIIPVLMLLALPLVANADDDYDDAACQKTYDAWKKKNAELIQHELDFVFSASECRVGGVYENPERTDPPYLSWKKFRAEFVIWDLLDRDIRSGKLKLGPMAEFIFRRWAMPWRSPSRGNYDPGHVLTWTGNWSEIERGPPPEGWVSSGVDDEGRAVDSDGNLSTGSPNWFKYMLVPSLLGLIAGVYVARKTQSSALAGWAFLGVIIAYGYFTDPWEVFACFFSVAIVIVMFAWAGMKLVLSGLGFGKK